MFEEILECEKPVYKVLFIATEPSVQATFVKKDGKTVREICFVPNTEWNKLTGNKGCEIGRKIVRTKVQRGMIGVTEMITDGVTFKFQPRTINLKTCISLKMM